MDVIRGTTPAKRRQRLWSPRPALRIVGASPPPVRFTRDDRLLLAMVGSFCLFVLVFAMFMGAWTGG